jgi:hypothetical protein
VEISTSSPSSFSNLTEGNLSPSCSLEVDDDLGFGLTFSSFSSFSSALGAFDVLISTSTFDSFFDFDFTSEAVSTLTFLLVSFSSSADLYSIS